MSEPASDVSGRCYENAGNEPLLALLPQRSGRVLDCGCGAGDNARLLSQRGWQVSGVTLSEQERSAASAFCDRVWISDLNDPLPADVGTGYDVVLLSHVLEHLARPEALLAEAVRVLAPGGVVAVALPNVLFYPIRLGALFGRFDYTDAGIMDSTHLRFYTHRSGAALLEGSGLQVMRRGAEGGMPLSLLRRVLPAGTQAAIDAWACRTWPGLFGRQSLYLAQPRDAAGNPAP